MYTLYLIMLYVKYISIRIDINYINPKKIWGDSNGAFAYQ